MSARFANVKIEATHRYPTSIRWGNGYFDNDGMKYVVAESDAEALAFANSKGSGCSMYNIQRRRAGGGWEFAAKYRGAGHE